MDVQEFDYEVVYCPGKANVADEIYRHSSKKGLSRAKKVEGHMKSILEVECCHIINETSAITVERIKEETEKFALMRKLKDAISTGKMALIMRN